VRESAVIVALRKNVIASAHVYGLTGDKAAAGAAQEAHHSGDFF
jgi:hypothetical protein